MVVLNKVGNTNQVQQSAVASKIVKRIKTPRERNLQGLGKMLTVLDEVFPCLCCPECFEYILRKMKTEENDLLLFLNILCRCGYKKELYTSKNVEKARVNVCNKSMKPF